MSKRSTLIRAVTGAALLAGALAGLTPARPAGAVGDTDCAGQKSCITQAYTSSGQLFVKVKFTSKWGHLQIDPEGPPTYVLPFSQTDKAVALPNALAPAGNYFTLRSTDGLCVPGKNPACQKESVTRVYNAAFGTFWSHFPIVGVNPAVVKAGYRADGPLGVCISREVNNTQVGSFVASKNACSFTDGTYFFIRYQGDYLSGFSGKTWKKVNYGQAKVPAKAVPAGHENKAPIYICRMMVQGALVPGGLRADGCTVWFAGAAHHATAQYEVLVTA